MSKIIEDNMIETGAMNLCTWLFSDIDKAHKPGIYNTVHMGHGDLTGFRAGRGRSLSNNNNVNYNRPGPRWANNNYSTVSICSADKWDAFKIDSIIFGLASVVWAAHTVINQQDVAVSALTHQEQQLCGLTALHHDINL